MDQKNKLISEIYSEYKTLVSEDQLEIIIKAITEIIIENYDNESFISLLREFLSKAVKDNLSDGKAFRLLDNYINLSMRDINNYKDAVASLEKLSDFLENCDFCPNENLIIKLINENQLLASILRIIVDEKKSIIENEGIKELCFSNISSLLVDAYCLLNGIIVNFSDIDDETCINSLELYYYDISFYPLLSKKEEREMLIKISAGDEDAKKEFILRNLRLVVFVAKRYSHYHHQFLDLIQEGNIALMKAVEKFDVNRTNAFSAYAIPLIKQAMKRYIVNKDKLIKISTHVSESMERTSRIENELAQLFGRMPTLSELSEASGVSIEDIKVRKRAALEPLSIHELEKSDKYEHCLISDFDLSEIIDTLMLIDDVQKMLLKVKLLPRERLILKESFKTDADLLAKIGESLGISRERTRSIQVSGIRRLRCSGEVKNLSDYMDYPEEAIEALNFFRKCHALNPRKHKLYIDELKEYRKK